MISNATFIYPLGTLRTLLASCWNEACHSDSRFASSGRIALPLSSATVGVGLAMSPMRGEALLRGVGGGMCACIPFVRCDKVMLCNSGLNEVSNGANGEGLKVYCLVHSIAQIVSTEGPREAMLITLC